MRITHSYILLKGLRFYAYHGVGTQETIVGNEFTIDLRLKVDLATAAENDRLENTVSYAEVFQAVEDEMKHPSRLLEHVAGRICERLFQDFPLVAEIELKLMKRNPPMGADIREAGIEMKCQRLPF